MYPDWTTTTSFRCLNDGNAPFYMKHSSKYFERSRAACCKRFFGWNYVTCAGDSVDFPVGFYPSWHTGEVKCINATDTMPDYSKCFDFIAYTCMRLISHNPILYCVLTVIKNPESWLFDSVETCCEEYYTWDHTNCVSESNENAISTFTGKFYVNHMKEICQGDCPDGEGGGYCGGPVQSWNVLYDTAKECCQKKLGWIAAATCEARSLGTSTGSSQWYVDWQKEKVSRSIIFWFLR